MGIGSERKINPNSSFFNFSKVVYSKINMKILVTHDSPDLDGGTAIWLIKRFLPNWGNAVVKYVPAGERLNPSKTPSLSVVEKTKDDEIIHVDTGMGALDHHQTSDGGVCGASLTWDYVRMQSSEFGIQNEKINTRIEAIDRIVKVVTDIDHFREVFWPDPAADFQEFSLVNILEGLKVEKPGQNDLYLEFILTSLDALLHDFENRIWAEDEIKKAKTFETSKGKGIGLETINDQSVKLSQKLGFAIAVRKDPRKGYVRVKARPDSGIDLTKTYEQLKKMDPNATWFLHASKKMLLNGSVKNPKMRPSILSLDKLIEVLKQV